MNCTHPNTRETLDSLICEDCGLEVEEELHLPQNTKEAREVIQILTRDIIISNVNGNKVNATKASQEITDMIIKNLKGTK